MNEIRRGKYQFVWHIPKEPQKQKTKNHPERYRRRAVTLMFSTFAAAREFLQMKQQQVDAIWKAEDRDRRKAKGVN